MTSHILEESRSQLGPDAAPLARIRALAPSLPASDRRAAEAIVDLDEEVLAHSITEVAKIANVAESTVIRACKRLGFTGFQDLKLAIARDRRPQTEIVLDEVREDDDEATILTKVFTASAATMSEAFTSINVATFGAVISAISEADGVLVIGVGPSSSIAQDAAYRLRSLGLRVDAPADALTQHLAARVLRAKDVLLVISHTGATRETLLAAAAAREAGAVTAAITSYAKSPLTQAVEHALVTGGRQLGFRFEAMASRFAHLCVVDALYVGVALRNRDSAQRALELHHEVVAGHQL